MKDLLKTPENRFKIAMVIALIFLICLVSFKSSSEIADNLYPTSNNNQIKHSGNSRRATEWYETELKVFFEDSTSTVFKIDVYETLDDISVIDGNLSYWKYNKERPNRKVYLASYVNYYTVLSSKNRTDQ